MNIILHGSDTSRIRKHLSALKEKYKIQNTVTFDASVHSQEEVLMEMDSFSIFDEGKMIVIENAAFLSAKDTTKYDVNAFVQRTTSDLDCIVVFCCKSDKLDQRKKAVKELVNRSKVQACIALDDKSLPGYVYEISKRIGLTMDYDAKEWFLKRVGYDSLTIENELTKLKIYSDHVSLDDVKALVSVAPLENVFLITDALGEKNALKFLALYRNFRKLNMEPIAINALLASNIRFLFQVHTLMDEGLSKDEIASMMKAHPYRVQLTMQKARRFSTGELLDILESLAQIDQDMKMGKVDKDEAFEQFALQMLMK